MAPRPAARAVAAAAIPKPAVDPVSATRSVSTTGPVTGGLVTGGLVTGGEVRGGGVVVFLGTVHKMTWEMFFPATAVTVLPCAAFGAHHTWLGYCPYSRALSLPALLVTRAYSVPVGGAGITHDLISEVGVTFLQLAPSMSLSAR